MRKARGADLAAEGLVGAVGDEVDPKLALGRLNGRVCRARRHMVALGVQLKVVDKRLHRFLHLGAARRRDLGVVHTHRAVWSAHARIQTGAHT